MCATCGCSGSAVVQLLPAGADRGLAAHGHVHDPGHEDDHSHDHSHGHDSGHSHGHDAGHVHVQDQAADDRTVVLQQKVLAKNDQLAQRNREWLRARGVLAVNLMSSPGAGKTTLLERTARELAGKLSI